MDNTTTRFELPGFRFHPTEEELLQFYLRNVVFGKRVHFDVIGFLNIYRHDPWELPGLAKIGEREWYFFVPVDRKQSNGGRPNRTTEHGFWKATGSDRKVVSLSDPKRVVGLRKTLVFYKGRAPKGTKTDWVMNEYRLSGSGSDTTSQPKDIVLCKVYRKATSLKVLEKWAVEQEDLGPKPKGSPCSFSSNSQYGPMDHVDMGPKPKGSPCSFSSNSQYGPMDPVDMGPLQSVAIGKSESEGVLASCGGPLRLPMGQEAMPQLQLPKGNDWAQDPQWAQICSPWVESILSQLTPCADILNF